MGTITVKSLVDDRLNRLLYDKTQVQWDRDTRVMWLDDAQRAVVALRPDANSVTASVTLAAGTRQALPTDAMSMGRVIRNMGTDGNTPGHTIKATTMGVMDLDPTWHTEDPALVTLHWMPAPLNPKAFYVYPPATGTTQVEITYAAVPTDINVSNWDTATLSIGDEFANALIEFVLFKAFDELSHTKFAGRADTHLARFATMLGVTEAQAQGVA